MQLLNPQIGYIKFRGVRRILLEGFPTCTNIVIERWDHSGEATVMAALAAVGVGAGGGCPPSRAKALSLYHFKVLKTSFSCMQTLALS